MSLPDSTMDTSRPVLIKNFAEHYRIMSADSDFRFVKQKSFFFIKLCINLILKKKTHTQI
jgi:hypothetical protein